MKHFSLTQEHASLLIVDMQEKLFPHIDHPCEVMQKSALLIQAAQCLDLPIITAEQSPERLGPTIASIRQALGVHYVPWSKAHFSCLGNPDLHTHLSGHERRQVILIGVEAHICVLQTARDLLREGKEVVVANDAISSRSILDYSTAIAEMRDMGVRISSVETLLFEMVKGANSPHFKVISQLVKGCGCSC